MLFLGFGLLHGCGCKAAYVTTKIYQPDCNFEYLKLSFKAFGAGVYACGPALTRHMLSMPWCKGGC
ncbi:hypothetical protein HK27_13335 [Acetobacter orientalis]|nr:hypothetical protein HK27_13335 [Acetobacter orientalis]